MVNMIELFRNREQVQRLANQHKVAIVLFYARWDHASEDVMHLFDELSRENQIHAVACDFDKCEWYFQELEVRELPTIMTFVRGRRKPAIWRVVDKNNIKDTFFKTLDILQQLGQSKTAI